MAARLPEGKTLVDFANPTRIRKAFDNDMKAIREEYSRERSIIRKRIERMKKSHETQNAFYGRYGDLDKVLPSARGLSNENILKALSDAAHGLAGGYQSNVKEVREARRDVIAAWRSEAEANGDEELAELLETDPTPAQMANVGRIMGMIESIIPQGKQFDSGEVYQEALKIVIGGDRKESVLRKAAKVMQISGLDFDENKQQDNLELLKSMWTEKGTLRASYKKARGKRGS